MNPRKVSAHQQLQNQVSIAPIVLLPPFGILANVSGVPNPNLAPQFFQQFFKPGRIAAALKANDYALPAKLFVESPHPGRVLVPQHQLLNLSTFGCQITDRLLTSMKVHPDIYCHGRLLLLTQIMFTVSLTTNGWRLPLHNIRRPCQQRGSANLVAGSFPLKLLSLLPHAVRTRTSTFPALTRVILPLFRRGLFCRYKLGRATRSVRTWTSARSQHLMFFVRENAHC